MKNSINLIKKSSSTVKKLSHLLIISVITILIIGSCTGNTTQNSDEISQTDSTKTKAQPIDSVKLKLSDGDTVFVIAGKSLGRFELKQEVEQAQLFDVLGKADSADAAMCKSWSMWYLDKQSPKKELDVYAVCDANVDMRKTIQILRLSNVDFTTEKGITSTSTLSQLKTTYPNAENIEGIENSSSTEIILIDDIASGIAFEISNNQITSVAIHTPGEKITDTYLPFYK